MLAASDKCKVLALRGGGTKGAYESGALRAITNLLPKDEFAYDVVTGVSIGAVNAVMMAIHEKGNETGAVDELEQIWKTHMVQDLWRTWPGYSIFGGFFKDALLDSTPLKEFAHQILDGRPFRRNYTYLATDLNTGKPVNYDESTPE